MSLRLLFYLYNFTIIQQKNLDALVVLERLLTGKVITTDDTGGGDCSNGLDGRGIMIVPSIFLDQETDIAQLATLITDSGVFIDAELQVSRLRGVYSLKTVVGMPRKWQGHYGRGVEWNH